MFRRGSIAAVLACLLAAAPAAAQDGGERDCFWQGGNRTTNVAYPDLGARYWVSSFPLPPGAELILKGRYPHARYFSFNVYDPALQPTGGLADVDIDPDPGSTNPFELGARRDGSARSYTVRVVSGTPPAQRPANTIYTSSSAAVLMLRVYVPDRGRDPAGGVALPEVSMKLPTGQTLDQPLVCSGRDTGLAPAIDGPIASADGPSPAAGAPTASDPVRFEAFFNYFQAFSYPVGSTPAGGAREVVPRDQSGGFLSNIDNAYVFALANKGFGNVLVLQGRAPTFPRTQDAPAVMPGGQVRYWSICSNEFASQRVIDCAVDEGTPTDAAGRYTIVMSTPQARPANATEACGVKWIAWGPQPDGFVILRNMLPAVDFAQAIQRVSKAGTEEQVIGDYLPIGKHLSRPDFEKRGCAGAAATTDVRGRALGGNSCLPRRARVARRAIGPVRVGDARSRMASRAGTPSKSGRRVYRYCVVGGGTVRAVFGERARSRLVYTTARGHKAKRIGARSLVRKLPKGTKRVAKGLRRKGLTVFGVRGKRVSFVAAIDRGLAKRPKRLRRYVALARKG